MSEREFLLAKENYRGVIKLHQYPNLDQEGQKAINIIWKLYEKQQSCFWRVEEIMSKNDSQHFKSLTPQEQAMIKKILAFFACSDTIVNSGVSKMMSVIRIVEVNAFYSFQQAMETIHGQTYAHLINEIIQDEKEREELFNSVKNDQFIRDISEWVLWSIYSKKITYEEYEQIDENSLTIDVEKNLGRIIVGMVCMEGIIFSGMFAVIYWLKHARKPSVNINTLVTSNDFIARDEGLHANFGCAAYSLVRNKLSATEIEIMVKEIVEITERFNSSAIDPQIEGLSVADMNLHTQFIADRTLVLLGYEKIYNVETPFMHFLDSIQFLSKDNFFDVVVTSYGKASAPIDDDDVFAASEDPLYSMKSDKNSEESK